MKHRSKFVPADRDARAELKKIINDKRLLCGSLVTMARVCGNPNCKCAKRGEKHICLYLSVKEDGKRKMVCIPKQWEETITQWVENYKRAAELLEQLSTYSLARFRED